METIHEYRGHDVEKFIRSHRVLRRLWHGVSGVSFLAEDAWGQKLVLTYPYDERSFDLEGPDLPPEGGTLPELESPDEIKRRTARMKLRAEYIWHYNDEGFLTPWGAGYDGRAQKALILSEYFPGVDLVYATRELKPLQTFSLFSMAIKSLDLIHKIGFPHLGIGAETFRVNLDSEPPMVRLSDAVLAMPDRKSACELCWRSPYAAPEIIFDQAEKLDERADAYSFGALMYHCLTGKNPLAHRHEAMNSRDTLAKIVEDERDIPPPSSIRSGIPKDVDEVIVNILRKDPEKRDFHRARTIVCALMDKWMEEVETMPPDYTGISVDQ